MIRGSSKVVLTCEDLAVRFPVRLPGGIWGRRGQVAALDGVSFRLHENEILGVVGESGCGKSTLARAITALVPASGGWIEVMGSRLDALSRARLHRFRKDIQLVFQDPLGSLDPRMKIAETLEEPLRALRPEMLRNERRQRRTALLLEVGLGPEHAESYPHELSGGQCQRVGIARALAVDPHILVLDEALSALDVSVQAQIVALLKTIRAARRTSMIFISHDIATVMSLCDTVMVMYLGRVIEAGPAEALRSNPAHPYTQALIAATPTADPITERARMAKPLRGEPPSPLSRLPGCPFASRCPEAQGFCSETSPRLNELVPHRQVACHLVDASRTAGPGQLSGIRSAERQP